MPYEKFVGHVSTLVRAKYNFKMDFVSSMLNKFLKHELESSPEIARNGAMLMLRLQIERGVGGSEPADDIPKTLGDVLRSDGARDAAFNAFKLTDEEKVQVLVELLVTHPPKPRQRDMYM